jgi:hypothetical protein
LLAQPVHLGKLSDPRLLSSLSNAESRRDAYDSALVPPAHPAELISWLEPYGLGPRKLNRILEICAEHYFEKPSDLRQLAEDNELEKYFPLRGLRAGIELALDAPGSASSKTASRGVEAGVLAVKREESDLDLRWRAGLGGQHADGAQDARGNRVPAARERYAAPAVRKPMVGEGPLSDIDLRTIRQFEELALRRPGLVSNTATLQRLPLPFGLNERDDFGMPVFTDSKITVYDVSRANHTRTLFRSLLSMGSANCTIDLDVGNRDDRGRPVLLRRTVETEEEVLALLDATLLTTEIQTPSGWKRAKTLVLPMVFWEIVVNPTGALNSTGGMTGDPIDTNVKTYAGGAFVDSGSAFGPLEASAVVGAKTHTKLRRLQAHNDALSCFSSKIKMDAGMERFKVIHNEARMQMVHNLLKSLRVRLPDATEEDVLSEPGIAVHDRGWALMVQLQTHANYWNNMWESTKKSKRPVKSPFGDENLLMVLVGKIFAVYSKIDQDATRIPCCTTRRTAALLARLSALTRAVEYLDDHMDRLFDLREIMRGTKSGATASDVVTAVIPAPKVKAPILLSTADQLAVGLSPGAASPAPVLSKSAAKKARLLKKKNDLAIRAQASSTAGATSSPPATKLNGSEWDIDGAEQRKLKVAFDQAAKEIRSRLLKLPTAKVVQQKRARGLLAETATQLMKVKGRKIYNLKGLWHAVHSRIPTAKVLPVAGLKKLLEDRSTVMQVAVENLVRLFSKESTVSHPAPSSSKKAKVLSPSAPVEKVSGTPAGGVSLEESLGVAVQRSDQEWDGFSGNIRFEEEQGVAV